MLEAMLWVLRTGAPWRDLPSAYGSWKSVYTRFSRWSSQGVLARLFEALALERDAEGYLIDATIVRAHQDASGAAKEGAPGNRAFARRSIHEDPCPRRRARQPGEAAALARASA
jgi:putative transposase